MFRNIFLNDKIFKQLTQPSTIDIFRSTQGGSNAEGNVIQPVKVSSAIWRHKSSISFQNFSNLWFVRCMWKLKQLLLKQLQLVSICLFAFFSARAQETTSSETRASTNFLIAITKFLNPVTPMSDRHRISPYTITTISTRKVMRIKKNITLG